MEHPTIKITSKTGYGYNGRIYDTYELARQAAIVDILDKYLWPPAVGYVVGRGADVHNLAANFDQIKLEVSKIT